MIPVMCWCPICGVVVSLPECNRINLLTTHIASVHPTNNDIAQICLGLEKPQFKRNVVNKCSVINIAENILLKKKTTIKIKFGSS